MSIKQKPMKWLKRDTMNSQSGVVITDMQRTRNLNIYDDLIFNVNMPLLRT
jgi:hypothetical protein